MRVVKEVLSHKFPSILLAILLISNFLWFSVNLSKEEKESERAKLYPLLSKRIFLDDPNDVLINFIELRNQLNNYTSPLNSKLGMYFEYLPSGTSININEDKEVRLSSLAKVPTVMAAYKMVYQGSKAKDDLLIIQENHRDKRFGSLWKKQAGEKVTLEEAARLALVESDNTAHNLLLANIPIEEINRVYDSLDIPYEEREGYPVISAKNYSSILRTLYLSAYLPKEYSNKILQIMTESIYRDKLPAKLPPHIKIAHKIGVFERTPPNTSAFSDCGIVYLPLRPYLLCMTYEGSNEDAQLHMSTISKMVYEYLSKVH